MASIDHYVMYNEQLQETVFKIKLMEQVEDEKKNKQKEKIIKKCTHYENNIQVYAKCCNKYYDCHLCHNEENNHKFNRYSLNKIKCTDCSTENNLGNTCIECKVTFAKNHCNVCNIWCSKLNNMYHCNDCGICRMGKKEDFFHCNKCNMCLSVNCKDSHNCGNISMDEDCPICLDKIFNSGKDIILLKCSHLIHDLCLKAHIKSCDQNDKIAGCTLCKKSVVKFSSYESKFDKYIQNYPMPDHYKNWTTDILCNDCCVKSNVKYHSKHHKCIGCKSYNTSIVNVNRK